jgi:hypothetical protein
MLFLFLVLFPLPISLSGFAQKDGRPGRKCVQVTTASRQRRGGDCRRVPYRHSRDAPAGVVALGARVARGQREPGKASTGRQGDGTGRDGAGGSRWRQGGAAPDEVAVSGTGGAGPVASGKDGRGIVRIGAHHARSASEAACTARCRLPGQPRRAGGDGAPAGIDPSLRRRTAVTRRDPCARRLEPGDSSLVLARLPRYTWTGARPRGK